MSEGRANARPLFPGYSRTVRSSFKPVLTTAAGLVLAGAIAATAGVVARRTAAPPLVSVASAAPPVAPPVWDLSNGMRPVSNRYTPTAYWDIRAAMQRAGAASRAGKREEAVAILVDPALEKASGAIVERYLAVRVEGGPGSLGHAEAALLVARLFDLTYAIGQPGQRGVRLGEVLLLDGRSPPSPAAIFRDASDYGAFLEMRLLSLVEAWTRVWQDVSGSQPVAESTRRYVAETGKRASWSDIDVLGVYRELGVDVPPAVLADGRFKEWPAFQQWLDREDARFVGVETVKP